MIDRLEQGLQRLRIVGREEGLGHFGDAGHVADVVAEFCPRRSPYLV